MTTAMPSKPETGAIPSESLEMLFAALESPLLAFAMKLAQQTEAAQDIVQEAFLRLHADFETVRRPRPWLYRTVHNLAANYRRNNRKIVPLLQPGNGFEVSDWPDDAPAPDLELERVESADQTRRCLAALDERSRRLIRLKFEERYSYRQISETTGLSISNVGYILHHALKQLAEELARRGVAP
jgi:RNA polymerase sigma factor (sigma-70 family)